MAPPEFRESGVIAVGRDQLAAPFDGRRCQIGVGYQRPLDPAAQPDEDVPVSSPGTDQDRAEPRHKLLAEADPVSLGVRGSKILRFFTIRKKPASTTPDSANGADEAVNARRQAA